MRRHTGSQSINGRVLLIELPTNSVFMRLRRRRRRRVHECWGRGRGRGGGRGRASLAIGSLQIEMLEPAEIVFNLQAATTLLRLLAAHNPNKKTTSKEQRQGRKGDKGGGQEAGSHQSANHTQFPGTRPAHYFDFIYLWASSKSIIGIGDRDRERARGTRSKAALTLALEEILSGKLIMSGSSGKTDC